MDQDKTMITLIKSAIEKGLRDSKEEPERAFRYLIDLATNFAETSYQKDLLNMLQKTLNDSNNKYYQLLNKIASEVDNQTLIEFGVNLGYRSLISEAETLRKNNQNLNYNDWTCFIEPKNNLDFSEYNKLILNKKNQGINNYIIFNKNISNLNKIISNHEDSVFSIFTKPAAINNDSLKKFSNLNNIYFSVELNNYKNPNNNFKETLNLLNKKTKLYGFHYYYDDFIAKNIIDDDWLKTIKNYQSNFCCLIPEGKNTHSKKVHEFIIESRKNLKYPIFLFDLHYDLEMIGKVILTPPAWR